MSDPALIPDPIIEAAVRALRESVGMSQYGRAEVVLTAVAPLIRAAVLERAAKVADFRGDALDSDNLAGRLAAREIAGAIRALKEQP